MLSTPSDTATALEAGKRRAAGRRLRTFLRNRTSIVGAVLTLVLVLVAAFSHWLAPHDVLKQDVFNRFAAPSGEHLLGTDGYGRDVLSRVLVGLRISLTVGVLSTALGLVLGTVLGTIAGYYRGRTGELIMRSMDVVMSFPGEVLGVVIVIALGSGLWKITLAVGLLLIPRFARLAYVPTLSIREEAFVLSGRSLGMRDLRLLSMHVVPNIISELLVMATLWVGTAVRLEANLSFLGLGVPPPTPTLGNMVREGVDKLAVAPWLSLSAGFAIMLVILGINTLGDGLRDVTDPKLQV